MAERLKIYACSGIGEAKSDYIYWTDNTDTISNTQAVNTLLVRINSLYTRITYLHGISDKEKIQALNEIDMYCVMLDAAKRFKNDEKMLYHAGEVISVMDTDGAFDFDSLDNTERDQHLDGLLSRAAEMYGDETIKSEDLAFMADWKDQIITRNKVGLSKEEQTASRKALKKATKAINGIGAADPAWMDNEELSKYLTKAGTYFLYLYFTDAQLAKLPSIFKVKRKDQQTIYNHCKRFFIDVYGSEEDMQEIIRNGIRQEFHDEPEKVCADVFSGKRESIGIATEIIVAIINAIVTLLGVLVTALCNMATQRDIAKYGSLKQETIDEGVPNGDDFKGLNFGSETKKSSWVAIALAGAAALLLFKK